MDFGWSLRRSITCSTPFFFFFLFFFSSNKNNQNGTGSGILTDRGRRRQTLFFFFFLSHSFPAQSLSSLHSFAGGRGGGVKVKVSPLGFMCGGRWYYSFRFFCMFSLLKKEGFFFF